MWNKTRTSQIPPSPLRRWIVVELLPSMLAFLFAAPCATAAAHGSPSPPGQGDSPQARQPVLVELFTSEGCSDCPPADELLARLDAAQFVAGAQAIVLSEHVTYWNHNGWVDPYSLEEMTERQSRYVSRFHLDSAYTPQVVVDGAAQMVGGNRAALSRAIAIAAQTAKPALRIEGANWHGNTIGFQVRAQEGLRGVLNIALAEDAASSAVGRGENAGRTLRHVAVARLIRSMGRDVTDGRPLAFQVGNGSTLAGRACRLIAFVTEEEGGRVLAVAEVPVSRP